MLCQINSFHRGVRQRDPFSPYLFDLVMQKLGHMIEATMKGGIGNLCYFLVEVLPYLTFFFADGLLLFCKAKDKGVDCLNHVLDKFYHYSVHHVNSLKTQVFFSRNVPEEVALRLSVKLGFTKVDDLGKYLGVPFFHNRVEVGTFQFLVDKVRGRLNGWDARKLSLEGFLTL